MVFVSFSRGPNALGMWDEFNVVDDLARPAGPREELNPPALRRFRSEGGGPSCRAVPFPDWCLDLGPVQDGEVARACYIAERVRLFVQLQGLGPAAFVRDGHARIEGDGLEAAAAVSGRLHYAASLVAVFEDADPGPRAEGQVAQHVAGAQRDYQEVLGVVPVGVPAEGGIGRAEDVGLTFRACAEVAAVAGVVPSAPPQVAFPLESDPILMRLVAYHDRASSWETRELPPRSMPGSPRRPGIE